jgi:hypothetical protein
METKIKLLHNSEIDLHRWNKVVQQATNNRVYAESWYLDCLAPDWQGLVYGDYQYVMPVIVAAKLGIHYASQPPYAQQQGIFPPATPAITLEFIQKLKIEFRYFNISLNAYNVSVEEWVDVEKRKNHILSLKPDIDTLQKAYTAHARRYLRKAINHIEVLPNITSEAYLKLKSENTHKGFTADHHHILKLIITRSLSNGGGIIYGAYSKRNELCAAAFFLKEQKRFTYLNSVSTPEGKADRAMYAIVNRFIADHAGTSYLLDFEGSNIEGIARFFEGFGAQPETYQHIKYNNLPWFLKLIKR